MGEWVWLPHTPCFPSLPSALCQYITTKPTNGEVGREGEGGGGGIVWTSHKARPSPGEAGRCWGEPFLSIRAKRPCW